MGNCTGNSRRAMTPSFGDGPRRNPTSNVPGKVNIHPVTYKLNSLDIVANVYTPANFDPAKKYAAVVVAHPNGGVKEQTAGLYAQRLAEHGYVAIAADAAYQGGASLGGHADEPHRGHPRHGRLHHQLRRGECCATRPPRHLRWRRLPWAACSLAAHRIVKDDSSRS